MFSQTFTQTGQYFYTDISVISVTFRNSGVSHDIYHMCGVHGVCWDGVVIVSYQ